MVIEKDTSNFFNSLLFPKLFQTFRMSIQPSKLILAFLAMAVIYLTGWVMDLIFMAISNSEGGVFSILWLSASQRFHGALEALFTFNLLGVINNISGYLAIFGATFKEHYIYCLIFLVIKLAVISLAGGAICRIAALQCAQGEKPGFSEALRFSTKKFTSFFTAPLAPIGIIIFIGFFIFLLGLVGNIPWAGKPIMVIFMPLALFAGGLIAIILIGATAGFNLMFPAVAYDDSDCFDAISRSFSYIFAKPWRMGFYTFIALIYGAICYIFIRFFAFLLLWVTHCFLQSGILGDNSKLAEIWQEVPTFTQLIAQPRWAELSGLESFAAFLVYILLIAVVVLVAAFVVSFYFSANTIIYSLMRKAVDNTALEDVYMPSEKTGSEPATAELTETNLETESESEEQQPSEPQEEPDSPSSAD
jgi:hypothetical protein